jgi:SAM-dependent methyltransferase
MVDYCRETYPEGKFLVGDVRKAAELEAAPFDAVLATFNLLDALDDANRNAALSSMFGALVPGGLLFMSSHNRAFGPQVVGPVAEAAGFVRNRDPRRLLRTVPRLPRQVRNHRRVRRFALDRPEYALLNDPAHDYSLLHYYMWREDQERQLAKHGFEVLECLDLEGNVLPPGERAEHCSELHYLARRPA